MRMMYRILAATTLGLVAAGFVSADELLSADRPVEKAIDHYINVLIKQTGTTPAPLADDATILRRLTLDLNGRIPTIGELDNFLASKDPNKKTKLVDRLMRSDAFNRHMAQRLLSIMDSERSDTGRLLSYLKNSLEQKRSWDRIFRDLIVPDQKDKDQKNASQFLLGRVRDLNRVTIDVSSIFFGVNVSCAQCHDHPHVRDWTQDHFYGMKSFFARTFDNGGYVAERSYGSVSYLPNKAKKQKVAPVMFLTGKTIAPPGMDKPSKQDQKRERDAFNRAKKSKKPPEPPKYSIREKLVEIALQPEQRKFFARAIANRLWYQLLGRGLVMPLDQMHSENPATHPELLEWLARDVIDHGYDLRRLVRGIVLSDTYARASHYSSEDVPGPHLFAVAQLRPLTPMQLATSLRIASSDPESLPAKREDLEKRLFDIERSAGGIANMFPEPGEGFQVSVKEAMLFSNNDRIRRDLLDRGGQLVTRMEQIDDVDKRADLAVRAVLTRKGAPEEIKAISDYMKQRKDRVKEACQQVVWALLTSSEFRFNH